MAVAAVSSFAFVFLFSLRFCSYGTSAQALGSAGGGGGAAGVFEQQLRSYCRGQRLGSVCDTDVQKLCQIPQIAWICQRGGKGRGTAPPTAGPAASTSTPMPVAATTISSFNRTRRPRRKHTTHVTQAPVTEKHQPTESPIAKKFVLNPQQIATIQVRSSAIFQP